VLATIAAFTGRHSLYFRVGFYSTVSVIALNCWWIVKDALSVGEVKSEDAEETVTYVGYIGCGFCLLCLLIAVSLHFRIL